MKLKLLLFTFIVFSFFNSSAQTQQDWAYLPYQFNSGNYGAVEALSATEVFVVIQGEVYKSIDGGMSWSIFNTQIQKAFYDIAFADSNTGYAVGDEASLIKTIDGGLTWSQVPLSTSQDLFSITVTPNGNVYGVGENGILITSTDNGATWQETNSISSEVLNSVKFRNNNEGFIAGNNGTLFHTTNSGQTWQSINLNTNDDFFSLNVDATSLYFLSGDAGYDSGINFTVERIGYEVYKSNDLVNWDQEVIYNNLNIASAMKINENNTYFVFGEYALCDCCVIEISHYDNTTNQGEIGFNTTMSDTGPFCDFNWYYFDLSVYDDQTAYTLSGSHLLKMNYAGTASVKDFSKLAVSIYPNPLENKEFSITSSSLAVEELEFQLYDISGKMVKNISNVEENKLIGVSELSTGIYFLKVKKQHQYLGAKKLIVK